MPLKLFYITNDPKVALIAEKHGVDRIWVDLETLGKAERQPGNSVKSDHQINDIKVIKPLLTRSEMLVRVQPWNENSEEEINEVVSAGADVIMLPMWKTVEEASLFLTAVNHRAKTSLLLETREAVECIDDVLKLHPDEIHIGLNDLHLSYNMTFMFEPLANGCVDALCKKIGDAGIPYGFGGIASIGKGMLKSDMIIMEHYRLGSTRAILSRSFCNVQEQTNLEEIDRLFDVGMKELRNYEKICANATEKQYRENKLATAKKVAEIVKAIREKRKSGA